MVHYKTIVLDRVVGKPKQKLNTVINPVAETVKMEAVDGWEFVAITKVPIFVKPGCIAGLKGAKGFYDYAMMIIYKKEDASGTPMGDDVNKVISIGNDSGNSRFPAKKIIIGVVCVLLLIAVLGFAGMFLSKKTSVSTPHNVSHTGQTTENTSKEFTVGNYVGAYFSEDFVKDTINYRIGNVIVKYGYSADVPKGYIFNQEPSANTKLGPSQDLVIYVSNSVTMPDLSGKSEAEAVSELKALGIKTVTVQNKESDIFPKGYVIRTSKKTEELVDVESEIIVYVSSGISPKEVKMPDLVGCSIPHAENQLLKEGLTYQITYVNDSNFPEGYVVDTIPQAGATIFNDQSVTIVVNAEN